MITTEVLFRTFRIRHGESTGTAFAADIDGRELIITARHVVEGISPHATLGFWRDGEWHDMEVDVVGIGDGDTDIAVLSSAVKFATPEFKVPVDLGGAVLGGDCYLLGYPYEPMPDGGLNRGLGFPFITKGCISAISFEHNLVFLDITNNYGFSGGPIIVPTGKASPRYQYIGLMRGKLMQAETGDLQVNGERVPFGYRVPVGLSVAHSAVAIRKIVEAS